MQDVVITVPLKRFVFAMGEPVPVAPVELLSEVQMALLIRMGNCEDDRYRWTFVL
jgi:hypothetical protein